LATVYAQEEPQIFGNSQLPDSQNITVTVAGDGKSFTVDTKNNLTWTFQTNANKYNSIYENGAQIVKDEMWLLWNDAENNNPHSVGTVWEQPNSYNVMVTQLYTSSTGDYNVTWSFLGDSRPKITLTANITNAENYRIDWRNYVYKDYVETMTNQIKF